MQKIFEKGLATMAETRDISKNSQKLFNYLLCLAKNPQNTQRRIFRHGEINLTKISKTIGISVNSIKKYWCELEKNGKIIYGDYNETPEDEERLFRELLGDRSEYKLNDKEYFEIWRTLWTERKKHPNEHYEVRSGCKYRNIPEETLRFLNEQLQISEQDMKIYQFLLTYREVGIQKMYRTFKFSMLDLKTFLKKTNNQRNHISIYKSLLLLRELGLINFEEYFITNQKGAKIRSFILTDVDFYVNNKFKNLKDNEIKYINETMMEEIEAYIIESQNEENGG